MEATSSGNHPACRIWIPKGRTAWIDNAYAAGISVRVNPAVAAAGSGSARRSSLPDTVIRVDDETRLARHSAAS